MQYNEKTKQDVQRVDLENSAPALVNAWHNYRVNLEKLKFELEAALKKAGRVPTGFRVRMYTVNGLQYEIVPEGKRPTGGHPSKPLIRL